MASRTIACASGPNGRRYCGLAVRVLRSVSWSVHSWSATIPFQGASTSCSPSSIALARTTSSSAVRRATLRVALLTAEEEVVLAKAIELGEQLVEAPWKGIVALHEWTLHDTERKTRTAKPQYRLPFGPEAHAMVRAAIVNEAARDLLVTSPAFFLVR